MAHFGVLSRFLSGVAFLLQIHFSKMNGNKFFGSSGCNLMTENGRTQRKAQQAEMKLLRCPYCVEGKQFKLMEPRDKEHGWYMCDKCGHLAVPDDSHFDCRCAKCIGLSIKAPLDRSNGRRSVQE